jgi:hypothetical protein
MQPFMIAVVNFADVMKTTQMVLITTMANALTMNHLWILLNVQDVKMTFITKVPIAGAGA